MSNEHDTSNTANANSGAMLFDPVTANDAAGRDLGIYKRRGVEGVMVGESEPPPPPEYLAAQSPELIVKEITDRIERNERRLSETTGSFDPNTGQAIPVVQGKAREALERELATLRYSSLPFAHARAGEIAAAKASLPTTADKLQAEADHRERVRARAEELALESEAKEMAERIRKAARAQTVG
jgi:hypothetical protein